MQAILKNRGIRNTFWLILWGKNNSGYQKPGKDIIKTTNKYPS